VGTKKGKQSRAGTFFLNPSPEERNSAEEKKAKEKGLSETEQRNFSSKRPSRKKKRTLLRTKEKSPRIRVNLSSKKDLLSW